MKVHPGVWLGLMGLLLSLLVAREAAAFILTKFSSPGCKLESLSSCYLGLNPEMQVANKALALEKSVEPQDRAAPLGPAIRVSPAVKSSSSPSQRTTVELIQVNQKPRQTPDLGLLDKFKPKFNQGVEIIYRLDDR